MTRAAGRLAVLSMMSLLMLTTFSAADAARLAPWGEGPRAAFTLDGVDGGSRSLATFKGRIVLVHFFATWCEPCVRELTSLNALARATRDMPLSIVAIDVGEVDLRVRAFLQKLPVDFPVLLDRDRAVARSWKVSALPSTIVLDADLVPRLFVEGDLDWTGSDTIAALARLDPAIPLRPTTPTASAAATVK